MHLKAIAGASSLQVADLAAGDFSQQRIRFRYSAKNGDSLPRTGNPAPVPDSCDISDRRYLIASITKPLIGMLAVQLAAEGLLTLSEPVRNFIDGFHRGPLRNIAVRHLLTHTSGLPDMLPNNNELRAQHATLADFVEQITKVNPEFVPGANCSYSSMGIVILAATQERLTGQSIHELMLQRLFDPLRMNSSWLGLPPDQADDLMPTVLPCELGPSKQMNSDFNWNSRYWRCLGAPWGGMISTADDLGRLAISLLNEGVSESGEQVLHRAVVRASTQNQTRRMAALSESDRRHRPWGFGWRLNWPDHATSFSDFLPATAIGHWGATGTMMWIDMKSRRWCVILTNQPYEDSQSVIQRMSNLVAAAVW